MPTHETTCRANDLTCVGSLGGTICWERVSAQLLLGRSWHPATDCPARTSPINEDRRLYQSEAGSSFLADIIGLEQLRV